MYKDENQSISASEPSCSSSVILPIMGGGGEVQPKNPQYSISASFNIFGRICVYKKPNILTVLPRAIFHFIIKVPLKDSNTFKMACQPL